MLEDITSRRLRKQKMEWHWYFLLSSFIAISRQIWWTTFRREYYVIVYSKMWPYRKR